MKSRMRSASLLLLIIGTIFVFVEPAMGQTGQLQDLDADNIAQRSLAVAESMKSTGYCYTGVSRALSPLGVTLTGAAAYEAREQLDADPRFLPVSIGESVELRRGDIIVFNKSMSHPYGHICVYQGNGEESSDHVARLTTPDAYGGVSVFRLRSAGNMVANRGDRIDWSSKMPLLAPDFRNVLSSSEYLDSSPAFTRPANSSPARIQSIDSGGTKSGSNAKGATGYFKRQFRILSNSSNGKSLTKNLIRFVVQSL